MCYDFIIGIDPGANGGIATSDGSSVRVAKMPRDTAELMRILEYAKETYAHPIVFIEKLNIRRDDLSGGKVFRIERLIANQANLKMLVHVAGLPYAEIHPLTWQSRLKLRMKGEESPARKRRYKDVAQSLYPQCKVTMANCDALLIMRCAAQILDSSARKDARWLSDNINHPAEIRLLTD